MLKMKKTDIDQVIYSCLTMPEIRTDIVEILEVPSYVYRERVAQFAAILKEQKLDAVVIYADREHFQNFEYFFGFDVRFEEGVGVIHSDGRCWALLGNECYPLTQIAKVPVEAILCPELSLPGQPQDKGSSIAEGFCQCGIKAGQHIGCVGWKLFVNDSIFDIPSFILESIKMNIGPGGSIRNITPLLIAPGTGIRNYVEAEQAAAFEAVATMVSQGMLCAFEQLALGISEIEIGQCFNPMGLPVSCHSNVSAGERTKTGLISPSFRKMKKGDPVTMCWGMRGGLSCRAGYLAERAEDLPASVSDYLEKVVRPYFATAVSWYENIGIGVTGGEIYSLVNEIFPKAQYGWQLNPGHCLASEEWLNSPVYKGSEIAFQSGQMVQLDIIPSPGGGYATSNIEDGILLADDVLQSKLQAKFPEMWSRIQWRRQYMKEELGIILKPEVLPLYDTQGILNPFLLNKGFGMKKVI